MSHATASSISTKHPGMSHRAAPDRGASLHADAWLNPGPHVFIKAFKASGPEMVETVKDGIPSGAVDALAQSMQIPKERLMSTLGLARATIQRKVAQQRPLSADESSRVLGMTRLIGQVQAMVDESGDSRGFVAASWVAAWLQTPTPALGGRKPAEFMDTAEGQTLVSRLLGQAQSGAYA